MRIVAVLLLLFAPMDLLARDNVSVRAYTEPADTVYTGQMLRLIVEVQTDTWFTTAPRYPELSLDGAIALLPESFGVNFSTRSGGVTRAGQRQRYVIFPQRSGELRIPPINVILAVSRNGHPGEPVTVSTESLTIDVVSPPGSDNKSSFLSVSNLDVSDDWNRSLDDLMVGDAITRTVTLSADGVFALVLPAIAFPEIDGFTAYSETPRLDDHSSRGSYSATREDSVTYVIAKAGDYVLPQIEFSWFDLDRRQVVSEILEAVPISVAINPNVHYEAVSDEIAQAGKRTYATILLSIFDWSMRNIHWLIAIAVILYILTRLCLRMVGVSINWLIVRRQRRRSSEKQYFDEMLAALRIADEDEFVRRFWRWIDRVSGGLSMPHSFAQAAQETGFADAWRELQERRYGATVPSRSTFTCISPRVMTQLRRRCLQQIRPDSGIRRPAVLSDRLNP